MSPGGYLMQRITRGEAEAVFHSQGTGGFHGRGPSDANRQVAIRPFYPDGLHYCVEDWHVLALALILDEELDGVSNLRDAKKLLDASASTTGKPATWHPDRSACTAITAHTRITARKRYQTVGPNRV